MKYKIIIKDIEAEDIFEFKIEKIEQLREILECFIGKTIEVDLRKIEPTRKLSRWNNE